MIVAAAGVIFIEVITMTIVSRHGAIIIAYRESALWSGSPKYIAGVYVTAGYEDISAL
jgi:hypothetical protein